MNGKKVVVWKNYFPSRESERFSTRTHILTHAALSQKSRQPFDCLPCLSHCGKLPAACVGAGKQGGEDFLFARKRSLFSLSLVAGKSVGYEFSDGSVQHRTLSPRSIFKAVKEFSFCVPLDSGLSKWLKKVFHTGLGKVCSETAYERIVLGRKCKIKAKSFVCCQRKTRIFSRFSVFRRREGKARKKKIEKENLSLVVIFNTIFTHTHTGSGGSVWIKASSCVFTMKSSPSK